MNTYILPEQYITCDLVAKTKYKSIVNAYERNDLSIIVRGSMWYAEGMPERIRRTVHREMKRLFPQYTYLYAAEMK